MKYDENRKLSLISLKEKIHSIMYSIKILYYVFSSLSTVCLFAIYIMLMQSKEKIIIMDGRLR